MTIAHIWKQALGELFELSMSACTVRAVAQNRPHGYRFGVSILLPCGPRYGSPPRKSQGNGKENCKLYCLASMVDADDDLMDVKAVKVITFLGFQMSKHHDLVPMRRVGQAN